MAKSNNTIRIISGSLKGRKVQVLNIEGLRPTSDRAKETLFNWLQFEIANKNVLDLFAGSGSLGLEAASRYAKKVTLVEKNTSAAKQLHDICKQLDINNTTIKNISAQTFLNENKSKFDVIFLDPPFADHLLPKIIDEILEVATVNGYVYCEFDKKQEPIKFPSNFELFRQKTLGQVKIEVWKKTSN